MNPTRPGRVPVLLAALPLVLLLSGAPAADRSSAKSAEATEDLERVRDEIKAVETRVRKDTSRRSALDRDLRTAEESAMKARRALGDVRSRLAEARRERARLVAAMAEAERNLAKQRAALASQLRLAHRTGDGARLQVILKQEDPSAAGRRLQYLSYLARQRQAAVQAVQQALVALGESRQRVEAQELELAALAREQSREVAALDTARKDRAAVLARADREVKGGDARLKQLRREAAGLERLLRDLERAMARARAAPPPGSPSPSPAPEGRSLPKGRWPVNGKLLADYGQSRAGGQMRWEGVLIGAAPGTEVRATRAGRVVYADWLPGMGLLLVLDHGQGVLSLYGHNQELTRSVGERVTAGQTIAKVGDTGGQSRPALYFEVRRNGRPQNPHGWIR